MSELDPIFCVVVRSYLKVTGNREALLLNFAAMPLTIKRVGHENTIRYRSTQLGESSL